MQNIVYYGNYLMYFDNAIIEYIRWIEFDQMQMVKELELDFHVVKATVEYLGPVHFDEDLELGVVPLRVGNSSISFQVGVFRKNEEECLAMGEVIWVCAKLGAHKSHPMPESFLSRVNSHMT